MIDDKRAGKIMNKDKTAAVNEDKTAALADEVLDLTVNRLLVSLRYLDVALNMHSRRIYCGSIAADGSSFYYSPLYILRTYRDSPEELTREYLHVVLHSVFMHPFLGGRQDRQKWDLACDIAVEAAINDLGLACVRSSRGEKQTAVLKRMKREIKPLTAVNIYRELVSENISHKRTDELISIFSPDDHSVWYEGDSSELSGNMRSSRLTGVNTDDNIIDPDKWKDIARRIDMELEMFAKVRGAAAGTLVQNIREVVRERYDYADFLRKFAAFGEEIRPSEDEFDYIYYTYGLSHYGNMPLIEPVEYREDHRIRDFVIAVDTSGSVAGDEVQTFISKTCSILKQQDSFFREINIHIVQCDSEIQSDYVIRKTADIDRYIEEMEIKGLGGTDFRPVFDYVNGLINAGAFSDLKGLIYFTDGLGIFPEAKPPYRTAFVFADDGCSRPKVPAWAIRAVIDRDELREDR